MLVHDNSKICSRFLSDNFALPTDCGFDWQGRPSGDLIAYFPPQSNTIFAKLEVGSQRSACQVNEAASSYLTCDGSWRPIGQEGAKSRFQLIYISSIQNVEEYELHVSLEWAMNLYIIT